MKKYYANQRLLYKVTKIIHEANCNKQLCNYKATLDTRLHCQTQQNCMVKVMSSTNHCKRN